MHIRELSPDDEAQLVIFSCATGGRQGWTHEIERMVRLHLTGALVASTTRALGWFSDGRLVAVAAWSAREPTGTWDVSVVAVATGWKGRRLGSWVKREVLRRARAEGIRAVMSVVHRDNEPMYKINMHLGARGAPSPQWDEYVQLVIPVLPEHAYAWEPTMICPEHGPTKVHPRDLLPTCPGEVGSTRAGLPHAAPCDLPLAPSDEHTYA